MLPAAPANDLHAVASDDIRQKWRRRGFALGQQHGSNVEFTREHPLNQFTGEFAREPHSDLGYF